MSKPWIHALSSVRRFGGDPMDYIAIHDFLDSSKGVIADSRHRALTHNAWFLSVVLERVFDYFVINSEGREVSVRAIGEQHVLEDFGGRFIPSGQDYLEQMPMKDWMLNGKGEAPPSFRFAKLKRETINVNHQGSGELESTKSGHGESAGGVGSTSTGNIPRDSQGDFQQV